MKRISPGLWVAVVGAIASLVAVGSDFYVLNPGGKSPSIVAAWIGLPHASDLVLASALVTSVLVVLVAMDRAPARGKTVGALVAAVGFIALAQLVYRIILPPFGGCLSYWNCSGSKSHVSLLPGIYFGVVGAALALVGGLAHMASRTAADTAPHNPLAERQDGLTPLLGLAAGGAVVMIALGFNFMPFYTNGFSSGPGVDWSAWVAIPKTADLVLVMAGVVVFLAVSAARKRAPVSPAALGAIVAVAGLVSAERIGYRILDSPFVSSANQPGSFAGGTNTTPNLHIWAFVALAGAIVMVLAGIGQSLSSSEDLGATRSSSTSREPATQS